MNKYPGDGPPTQREKDIFNTVLDRVKVKGRMPHMIELGCYNAYWSLQFMEHFNGWVILNDIDESHLNVGVENFKANGYLDGYDYRVWHGDALEICNQIGVANVDILHMDIQGAEAEVLSKTVLSKVHNIVVATHSEDLHWMCLELLEDFIIHVNLPIPSIGGDGFIVGEHE